jgi:carbon monoxide dehydrogenase subunit G
MASYRTTVTTTAAPDRVFEYLARFSSAVEWDPGVVASRDVRPGPVGVGSAFELTVRTLGREVDYRYEIIEIDRPHRVTLTGESSLFATTDTISVASADGGTEVVYAAELEAKGVGRLLAPVLPLVFRRICDRAAGGLERELARLGEEGGAVREPVPGDSA